MTPADTCYRLIVAGRLSQTVTELIGSRFGPAISISSSGPDSSVELTADQPALRALLTLLWDLGHDLVAILQPETGSHPLAMPAGPSPAVEAPTGFDPEPTGSSPTPHPRSARHGQI